MHILINSSNQPRFHDWTCYWKCKTWKQFQCVVSEKDRCGNKGSKLALCKSIWDKNKLMCYWTVGSRTLAVLQKGSHCQNCLPTNSQQESTQQSSDLHQALIISPVSHYVHRQALHWLDERMAMVTKECSKYWAVMTREHRVSDFKLFLPF